MAEIVSIEGACLHDRKVAVKEINTASELTFFKTLPKNIPTREAEDPNHMR
jgi:hypothetical protein